MATADYDSHDLQGLSDFVNEKVVPELEKTKGVASVDPTGLLEETVQIVLDHDKIDQINNKVLDSVDSELAKSERELRKSCRRSTTVCRKSPTGNPNCPVQKMKPMTSWRSLPSSCSRRRRT